MTSSLKMSSYWSRLDQYIERKALPVTSTMCSVLLIQVQVATRMVLGARTIFPGRVLSNLRRGTSMHARQYLQSR